MTDVNAAKRGYSSPLRRQQAAATRAAVLTAARDLFLERGYGATTVEQIAGRAGVSKPTVFTAVGNKQTLLAVVRDVAMAGDDEPVAVGARPAAREIESEPDPDRAVDLLTELIAGIGSRYAAIAEVVRGAAESGEEGPRELWRASEEQRLAGARQWIAALSRKTPLAGGLDHDTAVDLMWLYMAPDHYHRLVNVRGWSPERYRTWLADRIRGLLR
ncbi:TetR/AcrR family transcriptional regulator [Pseudonocardia bannensis]|uniref:Helix-turn-helix transcriptional regulator n=1 Tax=Pseudonocardia bannensis TaxID=630973 RepID=A0A848DQ73_9PSEU|nr:TetR/AcrR family transcriptional regulator [Pseudonocardia bannensis]NMH95000.1 helix-turn-helix transcriptional regulator [Pseudonocardia bannensis]